MRLRRLQRRDTDDDHGPGHGHDNHNYNNVLAFVNYGFSISDQLPGHADYFYNNTLVLAPLNTQKYGDWNCKFDDNSTASPVLHDNRLYTYNGEALSAT